jgi:hypothetical protein
MISRTIQNQPVIVVPPTTVSADKCVVTDRRLSRIIHERNLSLRRMRIVRQFLSLARSAVSVVSVEHGIRIYEPRDRQVSVLRKFILFNGISGAVSAEDVSPAVTRSSLISRKNTTRPLCVLCAPTNRARVQRVATGCAKCVRRPEWARVRAAPARLAAPANPSKP